MYNELRQDIRSVVSDMTKGVSNRVAEIKNIHIPVPKIQIDLYFEPWIDIDYITDNLQVSFGDVLDVVGGMAGGAAAGVAAGAAWGALAGPIGIGVGVLLGAGAAVAKKTIFGDGGVGKAKRAAKDELEVCKKETLRKMQPFLSDVEFELNDFKKKLTDTISRESRNLSDMLKQNNDIYSIL